MVRTQRSNLEFPRLEQRLDAGRIAGISAAIAIHAIALMALLAPMAAPPDVAKPRTHTPPDQPRTMRRDVPREPEPVPVVKKQEITSPQVAVQPRKNETPIVESAVIVDNGTEFIDTGPATEDVIDPGPAVGPPLAGAHLQYADAPPPVYPRAAIRDRLTGTVMLRVLVDIDGRPLEASIAQSSGHRELDRAAVDHVLKRWTFRPAMQDGKAVQAIGLVPIAFNLR